METEHQGASEGKNPKSKKRRITVDPAPEVAAQANSDPMLPQPVARAAADLVPSIEAMTRALAEVKDIDQMHDLHEQAAAWQEATKRFKFAFEEVARIAEFRIRLERRMGANLAQTVHRGGHGSKSDSLTSIRGGASAGLPEWVNKERARWYRNLAAIPEDVLDRYLALAREKGRMPSSRGLTRFAGLGRQSPERKVSGRRRKASRPETPSLSAEVIDAIGRFMRVEVLVGGAASAFPGATVLQPDLVQSKKLRGDVLVTDCPDPATWLPKLAGLRLKRSVAQVVVVLPATTGADWFKLVEEGGWLCCFTRGASPLVVVYNGERRHAFWAAFQGLGTVLHAGDHA